MRSTKLLFPIVLLIVRSVLTTGIIEEAKIPRITRIRKVIDPELASKWFLCLRNGSVQACRHHKLSQTSPSEANFQEGNLHDDDTSECQEQNCINGRCQNNRCICNEGWQGVDCEEDIDECLSGSHRCSKGCRNIPGSYLCRCRDHYVLPNDQVSCQEGSSGKTRTSHNSRSAGRIRKLRNSNAAGRRPQPHAHQTRKKRISSNEAQIIPRRDFSALLRVDTNISAMPLPFYLAQVESSGKSALRSINNFLSKINSLKRRFPGLVRRRNPCHRLRCKHKCVSVSPYQARCKCRKGYVLEGPRSCVDFNECEAEVNPCGENSMCINKQGSYSCRCNLGYIEHNEHSENSTKTICDDVNECLTGEHVCSEVGVCMNMPGFYQCACQEGYIGDGIVCEPTSSNTTETTITRTSWKTSVTTETQAQRSATPYKTKQRKVAKSFKRVPGAPLATKQQRRKANSSQRNRIVLPRRVTP